MIINLNDLLTMILFISLIILVIIFIILGIKLIGTLNRVDKVIDDVNLKMSKVDGLFNIIDKTSQYASGISEKISNFISGIISALVKKKKGNDLDGEE